MTTTNTLDQAANTEPTAEATTVPTISLDEVNGGWMYGPYAYGRPYGYGYASPYAMARQEARFERRAAWAASRAPMFWPY